MRFRHKPKPSEGETRVVKKFLFFPLRFKDETRWLESCCIIQRGVYTEYDTVVWGDVSFYDCKECWNCEFKNCCYKGR